MLAGEYKSASDRAFAVISDDVPTVLERYQALVQADARGDFAAGKEAYDSLAAALTRSARGGERVFQLKALADKARCDSGTTSGAAVCWREAAGAYKVSANAGADVLDAHLQRLLDGFADALQAASRRDAERLRAVNAQLSDEFDVVQTEGGHFARLHGKATRTYETCSAG
jgi:hypothetical protein